MSREAAAFRGSVMRAYVEALRGEGMFAAVRGRVSDEVGALGNAFDLTGTTGTIRAESTTRRGDGSVSILVARW